MSIKLHISSAPNTQNMLQELLVSEVRLKILRLFVLNPEKSFHVRAIVREVHAEINAVRRELENLTNISLLRRRQSSNKLFYTVDTAHMFYADLLGLLAKETGLGADILKHIRDLGDIQFAVISKGFLRGRAASPLDVDLFIVGNIKMDLLDGLLKKHQDSTGREINYSVMTEEEYRHRKRSNDQFVTRFLTQTHTMLIGDEEKFHSMV